MQKLDVKQQLLEITMEDCGELSQMCSKAMRKQRTDLQNLKNSSGKQAFSENCPFIVCSFFLNHF